MADSEDESELSEEAIKLNNIAEKLQHKRPKDVLIKLLKVIQYVISQDATRPNASAVFNPLLR